MFLFFISSSRSSSILNVSTISQEYRTQYYDIYVWDELWIEYGIIMQTIHQPKNYTYLHTYGIGSFFISLAIYSKKYRYIYESIHQFHLEQHIYLSTLIWIFWKVKLWVSAFVLVSIGSGWIIQAKLKLQDTNFWIYTWKQEIWVLK